MASIGFTPSGPVVAEDVEPNTLKAFPGQCPRGQQCG